MTWKHQLKILEENKEWGKAITFMEGVINKHPDNKDAYLLMNYLLMNLLVEEDHDENKHEQYEVLLKKYFRKSYDKFWGDPEYLFFTGITAFMSEWFFDITIEHARKMITDAFKLDPENVLFEWGFFAYLDMTKSENKKTADMLAQKIYSSLDLIEKIQEKGSLGVYVLEMINPR